MTDKVERPLTAQEIIFLARKEGKSLTPEQKEFIENRRKEVAQKRKDDEEGIKKAMKYYKGEVKNIKE